jgi:predicted hydrocarbon binding protein
MRTDIITELRQDVAAILSAKVARELSFRSGLATGKTFMSHMNGKLTEESYWKVAEEVARFRGWTRLVDHSKSVLGNGNLRITVTCEKSAFAVDVKSNEPVCDIIRGGLAASLRSLYDMNPVSAEETMCIAQGHPKCVFVIELAPTPPSPDRIVSGMK